MSRSVRNHVVVCRTRVLCATIGLAISAHVLGAQGVVASNEPNGSNVKQAQELLTRPVTVHATHVSRRQAVYLLAKSAHVVVQYRYELLDAHSDSINVHLTNVPLGIALEQVLAGTALRVVSDGKEWLSIVASDVAGDSLPATGILVGRVVDSAGGKGLGGVTVKVQGTKIATVTSDSGRFRIENVPAGDRVVVARVFGYRAVTQAVAVTAGEQTSIRIQLGTVPTVLSGVVTTAVGQQARYQVGNDITMLNADSILKIVPVSNVTQMLEGRVPGLTVQHTTGIPGAPSRLRLRGSSSVYESDDPIVVVDGIRMYADQSGGGRLQDGSIVKTIGGGNTVGFFAGPSALDQIDPNSIETIQVLKGPSASALYGSDAANGVIVITTKRGRVGPTHWDLAIDQGWQSLQGDWPTNYYRFASGDPGVPFSTVSKIVSDDYLNEFISGHTDSIVAFQALNDSRYSSLGTGRNQRASLTVSGGSGPLTYSITGTGATTTGYLHLPSIEQQRFALFHGFAAPGWMKTPDTYTEYGASSMLTAQLGKSGATIALSGQLMRSAQQQSSLQNNLTDLMNRYVDTSQLTGQPLYTNYYTRAQFQTTTFNNVLALNSWAPWQWMPINATIGINSMTSDGNTVTPRDYVVGTSDSLGKYQLSHSNVTTMSLTAGTTLFPNRWIRTAAGLNVYAAAQNGLTAETDVLPIGVLVPTSLLYQGNNGPSQSTANLATYGWYVQPTLNLNSRFFASPGFRLDGGSASGGQSGVNGGALNLFPKLDFSWIAVDRSPDQPLLGFLTVLRPRVAVGIAGVQPGPADKLRLFTPGQAILQTSDGSVGTPIDYLTTTTIGNTHLRPERSREFEGGFDAELWNQRMSLTLTGYHKMRYDAILSLPLAPSVLGARTTSFISTNIGTIRSTGVEATLNLRVLDGQAVRWEVNGNYSTNANKVISLVPGQPPILVGGLGSLSVSDTRITPGYPLWGVWARPIVSYADANHDGYIESDEVKIGDSAVYVGQNMPKYESNVGSTLALFGGRLSLNTAVNYQNGMTQVGSVSNSASVFFNTSLPAAQRAAVVAGGTDIGLMQTVNVLRWQSASMTYLVPTSVSHMLRVPRLSLTLQGSNLALHTNYRGKDPNVNAFATGNLTQDTGQLPQPRVWSLRVQLGS